MKNHSKNAIIVTAHRILEIWDIFILQKKNLMFILKSILRYINEKVYEYMYFLFSGYRQYWA